MVGAGEIAKQLRRSSWHLAATVFIIISAGTEFQKANELEYLFRDEGLA